MTTGRYKYNSQRRREGGFTLIEIMVAVTVLGMIMALISMSFSSTVRARQRIEAQMDLYQMGRLAMDNMSRDISSAFISNTNENLQEEQITGFVGKDGTEGDMPHDELHLISLSRSELFPGPDIAEIGYFLTEIKDLDTNFLQRRIDPYPDDDIMEGGTVYDIAEQVSGLNFRYLDGDNQWVDTWDSEALNNMLPQAVEITIEMEGLRGEKAMLRTVVKAELFRRSAQ